MKKEIIKWLKSEVQKTNAKGIVFGLSGGIDSAVIAHLVKEAFPNNSLALWIDIESSVEAKRNAFRVIEDIKINYRSIDLTKNYNELLKSIFEVSSPYDSKEIFDKFLKTNKVSLNKSYLKNENIKLVKSNLKSRLRMTTLYSYANLNNYLVVGTTNKSEYYMGYFTKFGDSAVDLQPLINLTKKNIYNLGRQLKVNERIMNSIPTADLEENQFDEQEMGVSYSELDDYLNGKKVNLNVNKIIDSKHNITKHKRKLPKFFMKE